MADPDYFYDERMIEGLDVLPGANAGFCLFRRTPDWSLAFDRLAAVVEDATSLSEQTAVAITLTREGARPLPADQFILNWDDLGIPWDPYARRDVVLRHYATPARRWKLWLRGGPRGLRTLPRAGVEAVASYLRGAVARRTWARGSAGPDAM
jgi:hypothetical protein